MKTYEFKLNLNSEQTEKVERWLNVLKIVWNRALAILEWKQYYDRRQRCLSQDIYYEKVPFYKFLYLFRLLIILQFDGFVKYLLPLIAAPPNSINLTEAWGFDFKPVAIKATRVDKNWAYYCTIAAEFRKDKSKGWEVKDNVQLIPVVNLVKSHWTKEPLINKYNAVALRKPFAKKRWDWIGEQNTPMLYVNDYIEMTIVESWSSYLSGKGGKPRYKRRKDKVRTIPSKSFRAQCRIEGDTIRIPGLDWIQIRGLNKRLPDNPDIPTFKICQKASGYYLQLGVEINNTRKCRQRATKIELNPSSYKTEGLTQQIPQYLQDSLKKLEKLQQKLSTQTYGSNRWQKQVNKIAKLHEKIKRQRKGWRDWHSSAIADIYGLVDLEETTQEVGKPDPKIDKEKQKYLPNGAEIKSIENRFILDSGVSRFRDKIIQRVEERGGIVIIKEEETSENQNLEKSIETAAETKRSASRRKRNKRRKKTQEELEPASV